MLKNPPSDLQVEVEKLMGIFRGVVEDVNDPLKAGRVRVRIFGLHSPSKIKTETEGIPIDELPWCQPCMPIHEGSVSGYGTWAVPLQGSQVMLFFENGNPSRPMYFASLPAIPEDKKQYSNNNRVTSKNDGFRDPDGVYPKSDRLGEPDAHRLARGVSNGTEVDTKNNNRDTGVSIAGGGTWDEPTSPYNTQYPHNYVIATHGGILIELDSTEGSKRININHPSNTFIEIDNDGNMVVKNAKEKYEIVAAGKNVHIKQQRNITIDVDSRKKIDNNEYIEVGGDKEEEITDNMLQTIGGDKTEDITGNKDETIGGDKTEDITGNKSETIGGSKTSNITSNKSETIGGSKTSNITSNKSETIGGSKTSNITSNKSETIGGSKTSNITSNKSETIGGSKTESITGSKSSTIGSGKTENITGALNITVSGTATITAPTILLTGATTIGSTFSVTGVGGGDSGTITGNLQINNGTITITTGDVVADGVSLKSHVHSGVTTGGSNTGPPV